MPEFWYRALTVAGTVQEGFLSAPSERGVEDELRRKGDFLIAAEERRRERTVTDGSVDRKELLAFLEYLSGSFTAGLPLLTILDDVPQRLRSKRLRAIVGEIRHRVAEEGKSLSEAMAEHPRAFPQVFVSTIQAGEASGQLAFALQQLVDYLDWQENIAASVRQATMYPLVVLAAIGLLIVGLVGFVFPRIIPILRVRQVELPWPTQVIMATSLFMREYWLGLIVAAIGLVMLVAALRRTARGRQLVDAALLRIPVIGRFMLEVNMARVVTYLGLFYRTGVDLLQSLLLVERMVTNRVVAGVVRDARVEIEGGASIAVAFGRSPLVPLVVMRSLALGETTGRLDEALQRATLYYAREIPAGVRRVVTLIQPALIVVLGGIVLLVALAIMLPILNIYGSIGVRP